LETTIANEFDFEYAPWNADRDREKFKAFGDKIKKWYEKEDKDFDLEGKDPENEEVKDPENEENKKIEVKKEK